MNSIFSIDAIVFWIVVTSALVNLCGAMLGSFLVLRRMSLLGDAISHAVLPGLAIAFIITSSRAPVPMLIGALGAGLITAILTQVIHRYAKVPEDAAMGVVFPSLFALGVIMITKVASQIDLDPGCVLYGILESAALDTIVFLGMEIPRITINIGVMTVIVFVYILLFWKELKIVSFDPNLATTLGINSQVVHYSLMAMVAAVTVVSFEAVGSILIVAMLIAPAATAYLLTDRLKWMVIISCLIGLSSAIVGRYAAAYYETSVPGMTAFIAGIHLFIAVIFSPNHGYLGKRIHQINLAIRIVKEDILGIIYRWQEKNPKNPLPKNEIMSSLHKRWMPSLALWTLQRNGFIHYQPDGLLLTDKGINQAKNLIQAHRLWETYLNRNFDLSRDQLHHSADRIEHFLDNYLRNGFYSELDSVKIDPTGKPIPEKENDSSN